MKSSLGAYFKLPRAFSRKLAARFAHVTSTSSHSTYRVQSPFYFAAHSSCALVCLWSCGVSVLSGRLPPGRSRTRLEQTDYSGHVPIVRVLIEAGQEQRPARGGPTAADFSRPHAFSPAASKSARLKR